jgi:hypothetical protein
MMVARSFTATIHQEMNPMDMRNFFRLCSALAIVLCVPCILAASYAQTPAGPTIQETFQWLQGKIESFAGGIQQNYDSGLKEISYGSERFTETIERSNVHAAYGPNVCQFQYSWHKYYHWTRQAHQVHDKIDEDLTVKTDIAVNFNLYDLKQASVVNNSGFGGKVLALSFNGKKAIFHLHGTKSFQWNRDRDDDYCDATLSNGYSINQGECTVTPSESAGKYGDFPINTDTAEDVEYIPFQRDATQDNDELATRAAAAFNHLRDVCAAQKPASTDPF